VLSPQEREIMADITLDPDDLDPEPSSSGGAASAAAIDAWAWAALALDLEPAVKNGNEDASWDVAAPAHAPAQVCDTSLWCKTLLIHLAPPYVSRLRLA
jgi:hypothetical protein